MQTLPNPDELLTSEAHFIQEKNLIGALLPFQGVLSQTNTMGEFAANLSSFFFFFFLMSHKLLTFSVPQGGWLLGFSLLNC